MAMSAKSFKSFLRILVAYLIGILFFVIALWLILTENDVKITTPIIICYLISVVSHGISGPSFTRIMGEIKDEDELARQAALAKLLQQMEAYNEQSKALVDEVRLYIIEMRRERDMEFIDTQR